MRRSACLIALLGTLDHSAWLINIVQYGALGKGCPATQRCTRIRVQHGRWIYFDDSAPGAWPLLRGHKMLELADPVVVAGIGALTMYVPVSHPTLDIMLTIP